MTKAKRDILSDPVGYSLYRLTMPMLIGIVAIMAFNLVDAYYIGLLGAQELAALAFTLPITSAIFALNLGLSAGSSVVLARIFGRGDRALARRITTHSILLSIVVVGSVGVLGLFFIDPVFKTLGVDETMLPLIHQYMSIWLSGVVFLVIPMVSNGVLRASGDTRAPSFIMSVSALINGILDPMLIFGIGPFPELGLQGAALSTLVAWLFSCVAALTILIRREKLVDFALPELALLKDSWLRVIKIALPAMLNNLMAPAAMTVIIALVAQFGESAVAATGVGARLEPMLMIVVMSMTAGVSVMVGQNHGAGNLERVREVVKIGFRFAFVWQLGVAILLFLSSSWLANLFSEKKAIAEVLEVYLWIQPLSFGMLGIATLSISILNALQQPVIAILISVVRLFVLSIPLSYLGASLFGIVGVYLGAAIANVLIGILSYFLLRSRLRALELVTEFDGRFS